MSSNIDWNDTIKKEAEGINGEDFGEVQEVSNGSVLVQRGIINKEKFLIPQELAESYDGDIVRFKISEDDLLSRYREEDSVEATAATTGVTQTTQEVEQSEVNTEETIPLTEERLEVSKNVQEQQATITKKPVTETKTVEVPVTHEEVSIERRAPSGGEGQVASEGPVTSSEEITIPLKKEEVEVNKTPYVKEEVTVTKKPVTETRQVTEEVTAERISTEDSQ
ncbi:YsnF/AvaK domain-containing protein [Candidatus Nitrosocosmicus sp. T]